MMKRWLGLLTACLMLPALLTGCGKETAGDHSEAGGREKVTIALWSDQLTEQYGQYLQEAFPQVDFTFYVATNSAGFYRFKAERGDLPDILTVRRFSLRDVAELKEYLMDLSDTELASAFHQAYLRSYTYSDGTVNWLPTGAEVDSIIINKTLLEENGIKMPSNYQEFADACAALKARGIRPFVSNFNADYTCMEVLQGFSAPALASSDGREWRQRYESGQTDQLSEAVWLPVFERMEEVLACAGIGPEDAVNGVDVFDGYGSGKTAMVRGTGDEAARYCDGRESVLMPYFGETAEESWYLTYPAFQIAASTKGNESPERKQLILDIMEVMLGQEAQHKIASSQNMIFYHKDMTAELPSAMSYLQPYIDSNHLYIRLASADMFSVSRKVVQGMISGEYPNARAAFDAFNAAMSAPEEEGETVAHIPEGYAYEFDREKGSQAASAVMNTLREELGVSLLVGQSVNVAGNIVAGDYTEEQLGFLTLGETVETLLCSVTGQQLYDYMAYVLGEPGKRGSVINDSTLYVSSGFEMEVRKTDRGYLVEKLTIGGRELDREAVYDLAVVGSEVLMQKEALAAAGVHSYTKTDIGFKRIIVDRLAGGRSLAAPTKYIILR